MRIFSNFDTKLRGLKYQEYLQEYGAHEVLCFGRSVLYRWIKVFLPALALIAANVVLLMLFYSWFAGAYFLPICIAFLVLDIVFFFPIIGKYIDYKMDFVIVIPGCIMLYDQWGIFKKDIITVSNHSIKTISVKKKWFLYSVFDNGDIIVLTEGDVSYGEIVLRWIPKPEKRKNQLASIVGIEVESPQL